MYVVEMNNINNIFYKFRKTHVVSLVNLINDFSVRNIQFIFYHIFIVVYNKLMKILVNLLTFINYCLNFI